MDIIIGYIGGAYVGKDTSNGIIKQKLSREITGGFDAKDQGYCPETFAGVSIIGKNIGFFYVPLALEVKKEYVKQNPETDLMRLLTDSEYKNKHRKGLIDIGDGWREKTDPLIWIQRCCENIELIRQKYSHFEHRIYTVPDMRYINELPAFEEYSEKREWPVVSLKIHRPLYSRLTTMNPGAAIDYIRKHKNNKSERNNKHAHADIDIFNDGTIQRLEEQLQKLVLPILLMLVSTPNEARRTVEA